MNREGIGELMDRWVNEPGFRDEVRRDPEGAVRRSGIQLNDDEMAALHSVDWNLPDEELRSRLNKC